MGYNSAIWPKLWCRQSISNNHWPGMPGLKHWIYWKTCNLTRICFCNTTLLGWTLGWARLHCVGVYLCWLCVIQMAAVILTSSWHSNTVTCKTLVLPEHWAPHCTALATGCWLLITLIFLRLSSSRSSPQQPAQCRGPARKMAVQLRSSQNRLLRLSTVLLSHANIFLVLKYWANVLNGELMWMRSVF